MSEVETQDQQPATPGLQMADLANIVAIIDAVTARGAFKGEELEAVGSVRNRIASFVQAAAPQDAPVEEAPVEEASVEEASVEEASDEEVEVEEVTQ
jgi:hypothetical protein